MRAKSVLLLMLALGCGLVASIGITQVMAKRNPGGSSGEPQTQAICVAVQDIPRNDKITAEMVKLEEWPKDKIPQGALSKIEEVEGRRPKAKVFQGEPLLDNKLFGLGVSQSGASVSIPAGYRVISVRVDPESGASNLIRPLDRVDVLLCVKRSPGVVSETSTRTVLQDVQVFAVNDVFNPEATEGDESINARTVSLLVTPPQAEKITLATQLGQIRLALRSHDDKGKVQTEGAFPQDLELSDGSNREKEELARSTAPTGQGDDLNDFLTMLNSQRTQSAGPSPAAEVARPTWTVQVLEGTNVSQVELELVDARPMPGQSDETGGRSSGFNIWRMISPVREHATEPTLAPAAADQPAPTPPDGPSQPPDTPGQPKQEPNRDD